MFLSIGEKWKTPLCKKTEDCCLDLDNTERLMCRMFDIWISSKRVKHDFDMMFKDIPRADN